MQKAYSRWRSHFVINKYLGGFDTPFAIASGYSTTSKQCNSCYKITFETCWSRYGLRPTLPTSMKEITMPIKTFGTMAVDWEEPVHFDRLREERLARIKAELQKSEIGALLCFDMNNIRYITNTTIGTWAIDKLGRFCLLPQNDEPINWDFGIAAKHHQMYCSWLGDGRSRAGISTLRGAMPPGAPRSED